MPSDDFVKDFITETRKSLRHIENDVHHLMRFRWMVLGGAAMASFFFVAMFEMAKAMAGGR